jgi:GDP/UDP-N,N'-diacetylbacillosamine 2-epimerase (hydrolysing)
MSDEFQILLTYPNNDPGHLEIISMIKRLQQGSAMANLHVVQSLGSRRFHAVLAASRMTKVFVLGNSSAGLKEAGAFGCFTVNIGNRQRGRARGSSVIDVSPVASEVVSAVRRAFQSAQFETFANETPYVGGRVAERAADALESVPLTTDILIKRAWCVSADSHKWE